MHTAKEITRDEARYLFMKHMTMLIRYWTKESRAETTQERLEGLMHSILVTLDGNSGGMPGFYLIPSTHEGDKKYAIEKGHDYYPHVEEIPGYDIGGALHEELFSYIRGEVKKPENLYDFADSMRKEAIAMHKKMGIFTKDEDYE